MRLVEGQPMRVMVDPVCMSSSTLSATFHHQKDYVKFGPILVLRCRDGPEWTTSPKNIEVTEQTLRGRPALTRYLMDKYMGGEVI